MTHVDCETAYVPNGKSLEIGALEPLVRFGAYGAIGGGIFRVVTSFIPYVPKSVWQEALFAIIDVGFLLGIIAIYVVHARKLGRFGLISFMIALSGITSIVGPDAKMFGLDFYLLGSGIFVIGLTGMSIQLLRNQIARMPARFWITSFIFAVVSTMLMSQLAFLATGVTMGAGFVCAGMHILKYHKTG